MYLPKVNLQQIQQFKEKYLNRNIVSYLICVVIWDILFQQLTLFFEINKMSRNKNVKLFLNNHSCTTGFMRIEHNTQKRN